MKTGIRLLGLITALFLSSASLSGLAQGAESLPAELDGSMMPYDFSAVDSLPVIPAGYEPVYVSYIARHGARYLSSPKKIEKISKALKEAEGSGNLTKEGMDFLAYISEIEKRTGDKWGLLSSVGIEEEKRLGDEMSRMLPELFRKGRIKTISTFVPRVIMTMYEFNHSLERNHQDLEIYTASGKQNDSLLYFFDAFKQYDAFR
ncbi:MAG: histidine phosphatase family protein, partial [Muribaculaceae bacterium]|nr:histidine phosphatase family protein [Muribaculaceae bacterium]